MSSSVSLDDMPDVVHEPYAFLLDETGVEPCVERSGYGRMLLTHTGDRIRMTIQFRLDKKWRWEKSRLFIDGKRVPNSSSWNQYVSIFKDPDNGRRNHTPKGARKAKVPASRAVDEQYLPKAIASAVAASRAATTKDTVTVTPTISEDGRKYLVAVTDMAVEHDGSTIVLFFEHVSVTGGGRAVEWSLTGGLAVNALGYDVTGELEHGLEGHLIDVLGAQSRAAQIPHIPGGSVQGASGFGSADVRKQTVRRV